MSLKSTDKCRLCLVETEIAKTYELFKNNNGVSFKIEADQNDEFSNLKLYEKVEYCCGVKLHNNKQMPTRICGKCFNTVHMWFNFRQMCYNSQVFLTTQIKDVVDIDQELEDLQSIRSKLTKATEDITECVETSNAEELVTENVVDDDECDSEFINDDIYGDPDYVDSASSNVAKNKFRKQKSVENIKLATAEQFIKDNDDLPNTLTAEDYDEVYWCLSADNDHQLEEYIDYCATKNVSIRQLNAKAMIKYKPKAKRLPKDYKDQKLAVKLPKPSTYMCNICGNVYSKKPLFQHHMRMHSDVKPYQCEICNKSYRIMSDLRNHMYRHTGEKPFKCKYCDRHFMDRSSRHRHERIHTNSRPYKCNICAKSFTYSAILKNHLKLHSGEKDYVCAICNKSFTLAHQLKAHMLTISHKQKEAAFEASGYKILYETAVDV